MTNTEIAAVFYDIARLLELKKDNPFKIRAYRRAAESIMQLKTDATQLATEGKLKEIPGVGDAIARKITELAASGRLAYYDRLKAEINEQKPDS